MWSRARSQHSFYTLPVPKNIFQFLPSRLWIMAPTSIQWVILYPEGCSVTASTWQTSKYETALYQATTCNTYWRIYYMVTVTTATALLHTILLDQFYVRHNRQDMCSELSECPAWQRLMLVGNNPILTEIRIQNPYSIKHHKRLSPVLDLQGSLVAMESMPSNIARNSQKINVSALSIHHCVFEEEKDVKGLSDRTLKQEVASVLHSSQKLTQNHIHGLLLKWNYIILTYTKHVAA